MSKRKFNEADESSVVEGYIHSVSLVKQAQHSSTRYFDGFLQTSETELVRFVSFSPEKIDVFQSAEQMKSPVKLANIRIKPVSGGKEVTISKSSKLDVCSKKLNFEAKSRVPTATAPYKDLDAVTTPNISCSVKVKMTGFFDDEEIKNTKFGPRKLRTALIADGTQILKLPLWESNIAKVKQGSYYQITNLVSALYNGTIQLNTTTFTSFSEIQPFENVYENMNMLEETEEISGPIKVCRLVTLMKCIHCTKPVSADTAGLIIKCTNCQSKQKVADLITTKTLHLSLDKDGVTKKVVVFSSVLNNFLEKSNLLQLTSSEIEDHFLLLPTLKVICKKSTDIATFIE